MRNPEGGSAPCTPQFMYKVPLPAHVFFFFRKGEKKEGNVALNLTIWRMQLHSNRQQPST